MKICLLTLFLDHFNEIKFMFGRTLKKKKIYFFCGIVKLICELRHTFFINLRLWEMIILRLSALFQKNLRSAARKFAYSVVCGNTYVSSLPPFIACGSRTQCPFLRNEMPYSLLKSPKIHVVQGGCNVLNALNLEELTVKIHKCALLLDFLALFRLNRVHALIFQNKPS